MKTSTTLVLLIALVAHAAACSRPAPRRENASNAADAGGTPRPAPPAKPPAPTPPPADTNAKKETGSGNFEQYKFTYEKTGDHVTAAFNAPRLPHIDGVVVGAARAVILSAYGEKMENFPRLVRWDYKETKHAIKLEGEKGDYVFIPVKDDNKEIPTLVFWRVEKGTVN